MKNKAQKAPASTVVQTIVMQVISVVVSGGISGVRYSDGFNKLVEASFKSVETFKTDNKEFIDHIQGAAPSDGTNIFVILKYVPTQNMFYVPCIIYLIDRQTRHVLDTGKIQFSPEIHSDSMSFSIIGESIPNWEIIAKPTPVNIVERSNLFDDKSMIVRDNGESCELKSTEKIERLENVAIQGRLDTLVRLAERNPEFDKFTKKYCGGSYKPTEVSKGIMSYLEDNNASKSTFHKRVNETSPIVFYHLLALANLCDELKPLVDMTTEEAHRAGTQKMSIEVAALLSRFDQSEQVAVWDRIKVYKTSHEMAREIRKLKPERKK